MDSEFASSGDYHGSNNANNDSIHSHTWDNLLSDQDPISDDILDLVMDFIPDQIIADLSTTVNLMGVIESHQNNPMNEKIAKINAIQKSLMSCETAVNPTTSTITMSTTPPAYSTAVI